VAITETGVRDALRQVIDPELGINMVDLGLVYGVEIDGTRVRVLMTMTTRQVDVLHEHVARVHALPVAWV
jgi:metal-sulfur cluster biosynthetic enzyme